MDEAIQNSEALHEAIQNVDDDEPFPASDIFDALSNDRRRVVLAALAEEPGPVEVPEVSRTVAAREAGTSRETVPEERIGRVHLSLRHAHLPKLDAAGLVRYDSDRGTVERTVGEISLDLP